MRFASVAILVCLVEGAGRARSRRRPNAIIGILQAELPRNVEVLKQQPVPAYYAAYTLHDSQSTQILASFGAIDRSDENRQRFATVEVRVGDYQLDNTHPDPRRRARPVARASCRSACRCPTTRSRFAWRCGAPPIAATSRRARR